MANVVSADVPFATVRNGKAYIDPPWFRYLVGADPSGNGSTGELLHGNPGGSPTWGPVDLEADVTGRLPLAHGGIGNVSGVSGGVLSFTGASTLVCSPALTAHALVLGGGPGVTPSTPVGLGSAGQVLHANATGAPTWAQVRLDAASNEVTGLLPVAHGGTGTAGSTGFGFVVLSSNCTITNATLNFPMFTVPMGLLGSSPGAVMNANDARVVSVGGLPTVILPQDFTLFFIVHDKTSGGCSIGTMDRTGVSLALAGITGVTFTRAAASGLQAQVTAGANPRSLSIFAIGIGPI